jgi:membrane-associated phospholipid phosphatase
MLWVYLSLFVLFLLPMFCLNLDALVLLARRIACGILLSGVVFLLFPAQLGFARAAQPDSLFGLIHALDRPHNLVPSLHIVISGLILSALRTGSPSWLRHLCSVWFILICASVVLVHQHHLLDVLGATLVTCLVTYIVRPQSSAAWAGWYPRALRKERAP